MASNLHRAERCGRGAGATAAVLPLMGSKMDREAIIAAKRPDVRFSPLTRLAQRYLVPRLVKSIYFYLRYRCFVSPQSSVQLSGHISFGKGTVVKPFVVIVNHTGAISI